MQMPSATPSPFDRLRMRSTATSPKRKIIYSVTRSTSLPSGPIL